MGNKSLNYISTLENLKSDCSVYLIFSKSVRNQLELILEFYSSWVNFKKMLYLNKLIGMFVKKILKTNKFQHDRTNYRWWRNS